MQIEEGKFYRSRGGRKFGPMIRPRNGSRDWIVEPRLDRSAYADWYHDGQYVLIGEHEHDLVAEWVNESDETRFLIVCDLMAALRSAVKDLKTLDKDGRCADVITGSENAMAIANGRGFRAQSFAERERDLLDSNNFYLNEARLARRQRDAGLEEIERYRREVADLHKECDALATDRNLWQDKAITAEMNLDAIANRSDEERGMAWLIEKLGAHRRHLEAVLPYAESRVEDMEETKDNAQDEVDNCDLDDKVRRNHLIGLRDDAKEHHDKALNAVVEVKRFMGLA